jgi:hypothetical protein
MTVGPSLVRGYTLALGIAAAFFALGAVSMFAGAENPALDPMARWASVLAARMSVAIAVIAGFVTYLRARESAYAPGATAALNVVLALFFPFGTAVFLYWLLAIRKRERGLPAS